jgi:2,4-dienoyl-CoA reductase-like NADH-dependent reductase (Old Yellow Enzyme family)
MITEPQQADAIVREGRADLVLLGKQFLREPYWPHRAWEELSPDTPPVIGKEYAWALVRQA